MQIKESTVLLNVVGSAGTRCRWGGRPSAAAPRSPDRSSDADRVTWPRVPGTRQASAYRPVPGSEKRVLASRRAVPAPLLVERQRKR
jgi:hypothetical protein